MVVTPLGRVLPDALVQAWQACDAGHLDRARELLATVAFPADAPAGALRAVLGACHLRVGQHEMGCAVLETDWTAADPDDAGLAGAALLSVGLLAPAAAALERAVAGSSREPGPHHVNQGRALVMLGRPDDALPILRRGLELGVADEALARRSLAEALVALGRFDEALDALGTGFDDTTLVAARAVVLASAGRHADAASLLSDAMVADKENLHLLMLAADLAEVRGRSGDAAGFLNRAAKVEPENVQVWARLARMGRALDVGPQQRQAAAEAMRLSRTMGDPERAVALAAHAGILAADGDAEAAEQAWQESLRLLPDAVPSLSAYGHHLLSVGRIDEAVSCFDRVRCAAPLQGWSQLIQARRPPDDPQILELLETASRQPSLEGPLKASMLLSVAAGWDAKKEHDRAFMAANDANAVVKAQLPYDPLRHRASVDAEIGRYSRAYLESRSGWGNPSRLPVFVVGMPRSGTTLVEQILAGHGAVHGAGELGQIPEQISALERWERKIGSGMAYPACIDELSKDECARIAGRLLDRLQALAPGALHVIDKLPHNFEHIGFIKLLFPNATVFHCRREPRDIAISNFMTDYAAKFGGMGFSYDLGWIGEQLVDHDRLMRHWHSVFPGQIHEIVYEELVEDTEQWARRMLQVLGLPWEEGVLEFQSLDRPVKTASVWQVRQPVYKTAKARWKRYGKHLEPLEQALSRTPPAPQSLPLPEWPPGLFATGMKCLGKNEARAAEDCFGRLIKQIPKHAGAWQFLGVAQLLQGRAEEAATAMRHSIGLAPPHASWFENLAAAEKALGRIEAEHKALGMARRLRGDGQLRQDGVMLRSPRPADMPVRASQEQNANDQPS